jgi:hypothetical protein
MYLNNKYIAKLAQLSKIFDKPEFSFVILEKSYKYVEELTSFDEWILHIIGKDLYSLVFDLEYVIDLCTSDKLFSNQPKLKNEYVIDFCTSDKLFSNQPKLKNECKNSLPKIPLKNIFTSRFSYFYEYGEKLLF